MIAHLVFLEPLMKIYEFQEIIDQSTQPLIIDFWASWCTPCKITKPILESLVDQYSDQVHFLAVDADRSPEVIQEYGIRGIPTVLAIHNGQVISRVTGAQNKAFYEEMFQSAVSGEAVSPKITSSDRLIRLTAALLFGIIGIAIRSWIMIVLGGLIGFWGVYDRCPVWAAITRNLRKNS